MWVEYQRLRLLVVEAEILIFRLTRRMIQAEHPKDPWARQFAEDARRRAGRRCERRRDAVTRFEEENAL